MTKKEVATKPDETKIELSKDPMLALFQSFNTDRDPRVQANKNYHGNRNNDRYYFTTTFKVIDAVDERKDVDND
tara:strand:+ start:265 stop:486 length:222 start_codon:yes stop_codon:yes gene_type:complete